jgi:hypothetical protein
MRIRNNKYKKFMILFMILLIIKIVYCYKYEDNEDNEDIYDCENDKFLIYITEIDTITDTETNTITKTKTNTETDTITKTKTNTETDTITDKITNTVTDKITNTVTDKITNTETETVTTTITIITTPIIENCFEDNGLGTMKHQEGNAMTYNDCINNFGNCPSGTTFYGLQYRVIQGPANYYTCFCYSDENKPTVTSGECSKFENNADNKLYYYGEDKRYVYIFSNPPPLAITTPI